jgi:hypothetical protein
MAEYTYPISATSANTEVIMCELCDGTVTPVTPPHPIWTDAQNKPVIQLNAITLGGVNGLNS